MKSLIPRMHGGQKGFTLIELLVVIAILGVIAAVVALNVSTFFGRGTVQAANTELHQVQTAIISAMADAETAALTAPASNATVYWAGGNGTIYYGDTGGTEGVDYFDGAHYVYGPFRAAYLIDNSGAILSATTDNDLCSDIIGNPWSGIAWDDTNKNWIASG